MGAGILTAVLLNLDFNLLEANLYDMRMVRGMQSKPDASIVIVTLDDASTQALDEFPPMPMDMHAQFMEALEKLQPRAVGYLIDLNQVTEVNPGRHQGPGPRPLRRLRPAAWRPTARRDARHPLRRHR